MAFRRSDLTKVRGEQEPKLEGLSTDQRSSHNRFGSGRFAKFGYRSVMVTRSRTSGKSLRTGVLGEIRTPAPRFVVWAGPLKSLSSVTVRKRLLVEIGFIRQFLNGRRYHKNERPSHLSRCGKALHW
jgi:hypothetical protein